MNETLTSYERQHLQNFASNFFKMYCKPRLLKNINIKLVFGETYFNTDKVLGFHVTYNSTIVIFLDEIKEELDNYVSEKYLSYNDIYLFIIFIIIHEIYHCFKYSNIKFRSRDGYVQYIEDNVNYNTLLHMSENYNDINFYINNYMNQSEYINFINILQYFYLNKNNNILTRIITNEERFYDCYYKHLFTNVIGFDLFNSIDILNNNKNICMNVNNEDGYYMIKKDNKFQYNHELCEYLNHVFNITYPMNLKYKPSISYDKLDNETIFIYIDISVIRKPFIRI